MKFTWDGHQLIEGEAPARFTFSEWFNGRGVWIIVGGLVVFAVWYWFFGEHILFGGLADHFRLPRHL